MLLEKPKNVLKSLGFLLSLLGFVLLLYTIIRFVFYFYNLNFFQSLNYNELFLAFILGLYFDFVVLVQINVPFILISSLPIFISHARRTQIFLRIIFLVSNGIFLLLSIVNILLFSFQKKHANKTILYFPKYAIEQWEVYILGYLWILILLFLILYALYWLYGFYYRFFFSQNLKTSSLLAQCIFFFFVFILSTIAARGGLQSRILTPVYAHIFGNYKIAHLGLNAPFVFIFTFSQDILEEKNYFQSEKELQRYLSDVSCKKRNSILAPPRNVVLLIIESLGAEFLSVWKTSRIYMPSFDKLIAGGGALFSHAYANAQRSVESLPPLLASLPNWISVPIVETSYIYNTYPSLGKLLKKREYRTLFLHGGNIGTMYFDRTAPLLGLDEYYGYENFVQYAKAKEIPKKSYDDKSWGVFDEPFFLYAVDMINKNTQKPFFAVLFSLSSHHPYIIPEKYANTFIEGETPFYKSISYTDHALGAFFKKVNKQSWAKDTLFVITADHTPATNRFWSVNFLSRRRIPILFYQPGRSLAFMKTENLAQQLDIFPTILDFLHIKDVKLPFFGSSLLADCKQRPIVLFEDPNYWLVTNKKILYASNDFQKLDVFQFQSHLQNGFPALGLEKVKRKNLQEIQKMQKRLQAYIQYYNNGLIYNKLIPDSSVK